MIPTPSQQWISSFWLSCCLGLTENLGKIIFQYIKLHVLILKNNLDSSSNLNVFPTYADATPAPLVCPYS